MYKGPIFLNIKLGINIMKRLKNLFKIYLLKEAMMKNLRKVLAFLLAALLVLPAFTIYAEGDKSAEKNEDKKEFVGKPIVGVFTIGEMDYKNNEVNDMMDAAAYMKGEDLMLPIRYIAKVIGYDVQWNAKARTIIISDNENIIEFYADSKILRVNKQKIDIEPNFEVRDGRTYVSISNIKDLLELSDNKEILWDQEAKTISLILKK